MIGEFVKKAGDIYVWIYEEQYNEIEGKYINKCIISGKKLQRPEQNKLGLRMKFYFFSDKTSSFLNEPNKPTDKKEEPDVEDDTAAPGKIPQTGANAVVIISMIGIAIIATIIGAKQYKKYNIKY